MKPPPFAKNYHLRRLLRARHGVFLGYRKHSVLAHLGLTRPRHLVCDQPRHILLTAPTRMGKGTCILVQNALSFPGSMLILDPKGEFRRLTIHERRKYHRTITWGPTTFATRWNPLAELAAMPEREHAEMAMRLARAFLPDDDTKTEFWNASAKAFLAGMFQWAATIHPDQPGNLRHVYELLSRPEQLARMHESLARHENRDLAGWAASCANRSQELAGSILATSLSRLESFRSGAVADSTATSEFTLDDLLQPRTTLYLTAGPSDFDTHRNLMIAFLQSFVAHALSRGPLPEPMLLLLDEFSLLRDFPALKTLLTFSAGYNLRLLLVLQDFSGLPREMLDTVLSNCQLQLFFGGSDHPTTAEHLVKRIGQHQERAISRSTGRHGTSRNVSERRADVMTAQELRVMKQALLFTGPNPPAKVDLIPWYEDRYIKPLVTETVPPTPSPYKPPELEFFLTHTERIVPPPSAASAYHDAPPPGSPGPGAPHDEQAILAQLDAFNTDPDAPF